MLHHPALSSRVGLAGSAEQRGLHVWSDDMLACADVWQMYSAFLFPLCIFEHPTGIKPLQAV